MIKGLPGGALVLITINDLFVSIRRSAVQVNGLDYDHIIGGTWLRSFSMKNNSSIVICKVDFQHKWSECSTKCMCTEADT